MENVDYIKIFISLFAVVNPLGIIPIFISLTSQTSRAEKEKISKLVAKSVAIILLIALFFGEFVLEFFGITIDSFRVAGGILILLMAISMLHAKQGAIKQTKEEATEVENMDSIAIVPLAMPLLAGPGGISTVILDAHKASGFFHYFSISISIILLSLVIWGVLKLSPYISEKLGITGINIFTRIMGLILAAIAIEFIVNGLKGLFPNLV